MKKHKVKLDLSLERVVTLDVDPFSMTDEEMKSMLRQLTAEQCRELIVGSWKDIVFEELSVGIIVEETIDAFDPYGILPGVGEHLKVNMIPNQRQLLSE